MRNTILLASTALAFIVLTVTAAASLTPMSWGFPVMVQNQTLSQSNMAFANASNVQSADIAFPTTVTTAGTVFGTAFPTILQDVNQDQTEMQLSTLDETATTMFAYPWLSIGGSPVPSMGFL